MEGGNVIFFIFLAIMMVLLIRWSIRVFYTRAKPVRSVPTEAPRRRARSASEVRRTTIYTISADSRANDTANNNFSDLFWDVSPNTSRSRDEAAKEDKDLPSYEEVIRMDMREQVLNSSTISSSTTAPVIPLTAVTSVTPSTSVTPVTSVPPINIIPAAVTASTV